LAQVLTAGAGFRELLLSLEVNFCQSPLESIFVICTVFITQYFLWIVN